MKIEETSVKATVYLYGCAPAAFSNMIYKDAIVFKLEEANKLLGRLYEAAIMERDVERIRSVNKAVVLNEALLKEMR